MRKQSLRKTANRYLKMDKRGCFKDKKHRNFVIHKVIDDLFTIGKVPGSWQSLKRHHIEGLIKHWKKCNIKAVTIMRYMTIIRSFTNNIGCQINNIDNKSLELSRQRKQKRKFNISFDIWQQIDDQLCRLIMALQTQFGLSFSESVNMHPDININDHHIWITRDIAFNTQDRVIPIRNELQQKILNELTILTTNQSLTQFKNIEFIRANWRSELKTHGLPSNKSWRYLYAKQLYQSLNPVLGNYQTCWLIRDEMGIKSRNTLWHYLNE